MIVKKVKNLIRKITNQLRWKWRFHRFGWGARLYSCDLLTNPKSISIGRGVIIGKGARLEAIGDNNNDNPKLIIGDGTGIEFYFHCGAAQSVKIGKDVLIGGHVYITDHDHVYDDPILPARRCKDLNSKPVVIEDGCWLCEGCKILKGVTIGKRAVVAANSVVTKNVPPGTVVGGIPAKVIKEISFANSQATKITRQFTSK